MNDSLKSRSLDPTKWFENHRDYLLNFAISRVRNHSIAEDVVQETFLSAWKARSNYQGKAAERTWLTRILLNKISDFYRSASRKPTLFTSQLEVDSSDAETLDALNFAQNGDQGKAHEQPVRAVENAEFVDLVEECLQKLPPQTATAFRLRELQGLSTEDIAAKLGVTPNHLWVLIHRAKKALRKQLTVIWGTPATPLCAGC